MPNSIADESYDNWKASAPGGSIANAEYAWMGASGVSMMNARDTVYPGSGSVQDQARDYWKSRAVALGWVAPGEFSVSDYMLFAQINGG